ncbi:MAG: hypothetical protein B7Z08_04905 [Sphingomonadales bacterium 32-68-7]|nr:MAG: hypothetical protein B7Z33_08840 [Sphingomonadales bacterium 12-68-11]OYX09572.1 MAG: hypothetical protein B7Z08_04905 [Sphingomonadales bacterium 32-68-7]
MAHDEAIRDAAAAWAVRTGDPQFEDWDAFTAWLAADPAHARAYDAVALAVADAADVLPAISLPANDAVRPGWTRRRWLGGALAASLVAVVALGVWNGRGGTYTVETAPGETRVIALADGGQIALGGGSRLVLDRRDSRLASLERGQALFTIEHDPSAPFRLTVGEDTLVDVGTVFDVTHSAAGMALAVSEGAVVFNPDKQNVQVDPGQRLTSASGSDRYEVGLIPLAEVGEWQRGRLTFRDAPLVQVASDLSRATGVAFVVAPRAAERSVSGSLVLDRVKADPRTVGALLGVTIRHTGEAWEIGAG